MLTDSNFFSKIVVLGICIVAALFIGFALSDPLGFDSVIMIGGCVGILMLPLMLKWHHATLIFVWNASMIVPFLPGHPKFIFFVAPVSLCLAIATRALNRQAVKSIRVPAVTYSLIFLGLVVLITAFLRGGFGASSLGEASSGAKRYLGVLGAVLGYFALTSQAVPQNRAKLYCCLFLISGLTYAISDLIYAAGPRFYVLYNFFEVEMAYQQAKTEDTLFRLAGVTFGAIFGCYFLLMRYGITGICDWKKAWRGLLFLALIGISLLGGFRSALIIIGLGCIVQCFFESVKGRLLIGLLLTMILAGAVLIIFAEKMPLSVQRSLSFLPIRDIDPVARADAEDSLNGRIEIWKVLLPEVQNYLFLGKGFTFSVADYSLLMEAISRGYRYGPLEQLLISGNYHSGPLTILIPFGIWGFVGFLWFCITALKVLYQNYRFGAKSLRSINTFLLSFFLGRLIFYFIFYGQFDLDFILLVGPVGFSIALNGGCAEPEPQGTPVLAHPAILRQRSALPAV